MSFLRVPYTQENFRCFLPLKNQHGRGSRNCSLLSSRYVPCGNNSSTWEKRAAKPVGHGRERNWRLQFQGPDPEEPGGRRHVHMSVDRRRPGSSTCSVASKRVLPVPVVCHSGKVQAFRREAHGSQGAHVDITFVHGRVQLGVAERP
jgi:hypothetical protein